MTSETISRPLRLLAVLLAAGALAACLELRRGPGGTPDYPVSEESTIRVEPLDFDPAQAPMPCVADLEIYSAHLQMPGTARYDLSKSVDTYVREAGGADAAMQVVNEEATSLNRELDLELSQRNPFNEQARRRSDDMIAELEDGILLNEALAEAIACRL